MSDKVIYENGNILVVVMILFAADGNKTGNIMIDMLYNMFSNI